MKLLVVVVFALLSRSASAEILDEKQLSRAIRNLPHVTLDQPSANQLVTLAIEVARNDLDPSLLLAQLYIESRFEPSTTSRLIDGKRQTGPWVSRRAPVGWTKTLYCGMAQTVAITWAACLALRDPEQSLAAQATELRSWLKRTRGDLARALAGYGCGNRGAATGRCNRYPTRVRVLAEKLRRVVPLS